MRRRGSWHSSFGQEPAASRRCAHTTQESTPGLISSGPAQAAQTATGPARKNAHQGQSGKPGVDNARPEDARSESARSESARSRVMVRLTVAARTDTAAKVAGD